MPKLYVATNGLSVWSGSETGDDLSRMPTFTGMYSGSKVWALEGHPSRPNELLAGTESGIYRLDQARMLWLHVPSPMDSIQVTALAIAPDDPDVIIAGTQPAALYRTDDGGKSWRKLSAPMKSHQMSPWQGEKKWTPAEAELLDSVKHWCRVTTIAFDPKNSNTIWAGVEIDGAWRSTDGGETWEQITKELTSPVDGRKSQDVHGLTPVYNGARKLFMSTNIGIYVSGDDGTTWDFSRLDSKWQYTRCIVERADHTGVMFVTNGNGPPGTNGRLFRSRNYGRDWEDAGLPGPVESSAYFMAVHPADANLIFLATNLGQIYRSKDGGESWTQFERRLPEVSDIAWLPD